MARKPRSSQTDRFTWEPSQVNTTKPSGRVAEPDRLVLAKPDKPVSEMTEVEKEAFARQVLARLRGDDQ